MEERAVVTCFLRHGPEVLLLRRSDAVGSYPGRWDAVSGYAEGAPEEAARREVDEAVGLLEDVEFVRSAAPVAVEDAVGREDADRGTRWLVHPYLFDCASTAVEPNEEVAEYEWVQPPAILDRETVPALWATYRAVAPGVETVRADDEHGSACVSLRALEVFRDRAAEAAVRGGAATGAGGTTGDGATTGDVEAAGDDDRADEDAALAHLARDLRDARPSMGVVANRINHVMSGADASPGAIREAALDACERAVGADREAAAEAADVVGERVLTLSRSGTVLEALRRADPASVTVAESRPDREGVGVAGELAAAGLDVSLCVDAAVGHVLASGDVDTVLVGADAVLADGAVVNKVGTSLTARAAREADVDCYAVCSRDKVVPERSVDLESGPPEAVEEGPVPFAVRNPVFERTPARLLSGVVTEDGVCSADEVAAVAAEHADLAGWEA
jgi:translation initiation factor 2B subunit (eIF-2B alpha/beta/delta family)/8-oxo-dGTP pyrophosphatase MutT (NUDIX family)